MKNYLVILSLFATFSFLIPSVMAQAPTHSQWKEIEGTWGECLETEIGFFESRTNQFVCESKNGRGEDECVVGSEKTEVETRSCNIKRPYCHANSGTKEYTYHFNSAWVAHFENNGSPQAGHELDFFTWEGNTQCVKDEVEKTPVCADDSYDNYGGLDGRFDPETEVSNNELCENDPEDPQDPEEPKNPDVCLNLDGIQTSVPNDYHLDAGGKNCVQFGKPGSPENNDSGIGGGEVLGTSTGRVLGASTMAATGGAMDAIFYSMFTFGSLLTSFGIMKNGKKAQI